MHWLRNGLFLLLLLPFAATAADDAEFFVEGTEYQRIVPPLPADADSVEVTEFFWYGCPHCYRLEPYIHKWLADKPDGVTFQRIPAIFNNPKWRLHAQAFYTAEVLGVLDTIHPAMFRALHEQRRRLDSAADLRQLFVDNGVDGQQFDRAFNSFAVSAKLNRAADLTRRSGIDGVPAVVVDGKYVTDGPMASTYDRLIEVVNHLIAREQADQ